MENLDIREAARPVLDELNDKTEETVHLALFTDDQVVYMDKRESRHVIRMYSVIGKVALFTVPVSEKPLWHSKIRKRLAV